MSLLACVLALALQGTAREQHALPDPLVADGAWCWFADPRAVHRDGRTYVGYVTSAGDVRVGALDDATGAWTEAVLHPELEVDDHASPALLFAPDGRLHVFYSRHAGPAMLHRATRAPADLSEWTAERELVLYGDRAGKRTTYPNPLRLEAENDRVYLLWRGDDWKPNLSWSDDECATWAPARTVVAPAEPDPANRPYVKVTGNGRDRFHVAFTDGHPRNEPANSIRYLRYEAGAFHRADGTLVARMDELPVRPADADLVYDGATDGRAWVWDVAEATDGHPVIAFASYPDGTGRACHYHYARFVGDRWQVDLMANGGGWFPQTPAGATEREPHYSGGLALDHADPSVVYASRGLPTVHRIQRWRWLDGSGARWSRGGLDDFGPSVDAPQVRPVVIRGHPPSGPTLIWMSLDGGYEHYTRYRTSLRIWQPPESSEPSGVKDG